MCVLIWHTGRNVSYILWIYLTYPSGKELIGNVWKGKANLKGDWINLVSVTFKSSKHISYQISFPC